MSIIDRKNNLRQRMRSESRRVTKRYRHFIRAVESECENHIFGDWGKRWSGLDNFYQTNLRGEPFEFRDCITCGKTETRIIGRE